MMMIILMTIMTMMVMVMIMMMLTFNISDRPHQKKAPNDIIHTYINEIPVLMEHPAILHSASSCFPALARFHLI